MEGRWTITKRNEDVRFIRGPECQEAEVVPCDDDSLMRAARVAAGFLQMPQGRDAFDLAVEMFRAAGESPRLADRGLVCEEHPSLPWPHDECAGPGMLREDVGS